MSVKRYEWVACDEHSCHCDVVESAEGDMVDYEDYAALEQKLAESQREFRAADATIENLQMQVERLAADNAGLKAALRPLDIPSELTDAFGDTAVIEHDSTGDNQGHSVSWSWVGNQEEVIKSVLLAVDGSIKTPATDAFLAEVRAQGVEAAIATAKNVVAQEFQYKDFETAQRVCSKFPESDLVGKVEMVEWLEDFSAQIRKGARS